MPRVLTEEFEQLPLRVHALMAGVSLHDAWSIELSRWRGGITLDEFLHTAGNCKSISCGCSQSSLLVAPSPLVRMLLNLRFFVGRFFNWDRQGATTVSFAIGLTDTDRFRSLSPAGTPDGLFRVVYRFENEQLVELINRTVQAAAVSALIETPTVYRFYFAVYVRNKSPFTRFYMTVIDPFRKLIVYPSLLRSVRARWNQAFGPS